MRQVNPNDSRLSSFAGQGDPEIWEDVWKSVDVERKQMYAEGPPLDITQLIHRGYFEDLWHYMGDTAYSARYLEVGAGRGTTAMYLSKRDCDVTMLDLSTQGFRIAEANFKRHGVKLPTMIVADAQSTGLPGCSFDCVYSIGLVEHFINPIPLLKESMRLLKPDGLLFKVIVPSRTIAHAWPLWCLLNPVDFSLRVAKHMVKMMIGYRSPDQNNRRATRTDYQRSYYEQWMRELGGVDVFCIPYNPYRQIYSRTILDQKIAFPLYRHHYLRKKSTGNFPLLGTYASVAVCDLLVCRKRRA